MEHLTDAMTAGSQELHLLLPQQVQELEWTAHSGCGEVDERVGPPSNDAGRQVLPATGTAPREGSKKRLSVIYRDTSQMTSKRMAER